MLTVRHLCLIAGATAVGAVAVAAPVFASELIVHPTKLNWPHRGMLSSHDHASLRRGYQVYKEVCSACHSMKFLAYRQLVDHVLTEEEAKAECAEVRLLRRTRTSSKLFWRYKAFSSHERIEILFDNLFEADVYYSLKRRLQVV